MIAEMMAWPGKSVDSLKYSIHVSNCKTPHGLQNWATSIPYKTLNKAIGGTKCTYMQSFILKYISLLQFISSKLKRLTSGQSVYHCLENLNSRTKCYSHLRVHSGENIIHKKAFFQILQNGESARGNHPSSNWKPKGICFGYKLLYFPIRYTEWFP